MASDFENASSPRAVTYAQGAFSHLFRLSSRLRTKAVNAGHIADYMDWQSRTFATRPRFSSERERLWAWMAERTDPGRPLVVLEFGVAWGYATDWWLRHLDEPTRRDLEWHGFDRFTGLPRAWRDQAAGTYDAGGHPPPIDDPRVHWHQGDVEDTFAAVDLAALRHAPWLILFDLDLYEPTSFAWQRLLPFIQAGDLVYFDEAMDADERRVIDELVLPAVSTRVIGTTALALGLEVERVR